MKITFKTASTITCIALLSTAVYAASGVSGANVDARGIFHDKRPMITPDSIRFGAYDPHGDFTNDGNSRIEHLFLPWEDVDLTSLTTADAYARERDRELLITVEPWSWSRDWRVTPEELLNGIMRGHYDSNMSAVCSAASKLKSPVTIRWAQEMDDKTGQFTWSYWSANDYVKAYQHAVNVCRKVLPNAKYMWSPKGDEGLDAYYPGDAYVDEVGLSVFGYEPYDMLELGRPTSFTERTKVAYDRVARFKRPVVIAELGYEGSDAYVRSWAKEANQPHPEFPAMAATVYFNDREVYPWPRKVGRPDWRVANHPLD